LRLCLRISKQKGRNRNFLNKSFSFAVLDLDKAEAYPMNYVCTLPIKLDLVAKNESTFVKTFGKESCKIAQKLLQKALKRETNVEVKSEIERRLKLLEPKPKVEKRCLLCGRLFPAKPKHGFKQKYCPECLLNKIRKR
jgi:hypothetical protein